MSASAIRQYLMTASGADLSQEALIVILGNVRGGQELVADKDRVRFRKEGEQLRFMIE